MTQNEEASGFPAVPSGTSMPTWYAGLLDSVSQHISTGHRRAVRAANTEMLATYWAIGKEILDRQDEEGWGASVIDRLSTDLRNRFVGIKGFSPRNLRYMRTFAVSWPEPAILQRTVADLPWRHHITLMTRLDHQEHRLWYASAAVEHGWSSTVLDLQIDRRLHERAGRLVSNFATTLPEVDSDLARQSTKDPYLFDFLTTDDLRRERAVERALIDHVSDFLMEMGKGFAYVGRQVRLVLGGEEFFCDLLLYHLRLHRYVVVELKAKPFKAAYLGQLGLYIAAVDDLLRQPGDDPTVGLLLCKTKNQTVVEYALRGFSVPMGIAEYTNEITTELPAELTADLPTIAELESELSADPTDSSAPG